MQSINIVNHSGASFPIVISNNNIQLKDYSHTLTLYIKYTGDSYLIKNAELKVCRQRGRPSKFANDSTSQCIYSIYNVYLFTCLFYDI
jgi:hypothetical protein